MPQFIGYPRQNKIRRTPSQLIDRRLRGARERLLAGMQYRQTKREREWHENEDQYMPGWSGYRNADDPTADWVDVPVSFSTITTIVPFVTGHEPTFIVEPFDDESSPENARVIQALLNKLWRAPGSNAQEALENAAWDYLVYGDGWLRVGFDIEVVPIFDADGNRVKEGEEPEKAKLFIERVNPWHFWIDPMSDGIHDARWVCQRIIMPLEELREDPKYKLLDELVPTFHEDLDADIMDRMYASQLEGEDGEEPWVAVYEFYDLKNKWMMAFTLDEMPYPMRYIEEVSAPYVQISNHKIPNSPYHLSELEQISMLQEELNKTRSQMVTHRRRNVNKWLYRANALDEDGISVLESSVVNAAIPVENETYELDDVVFPLMPTSLTADVYNVSDIIRNDILDTTGVNEYLRGSMPEVKRTATEASIIEGASNIKSRHKLQQIEKALAELGQFMFYIAKDVFPITDVDEMRLFLTGREAENVNRMQGLDDFQQDAIITPVAAMFRGEYLVNVETGSTELRNPVMQEQRFKEMYQILVSSAPLLLEMGIPINIRIVLERWFEAAGIIDVDSMFEGDEGQTMMMLQQLLGGMTPDEGAPNVESQMGGPNLQGAQPPNDAITADNSGILPPIV